MCALNQGYHRRSNTAVAPLRACFAHYQRYRSHARPARNGDTSLTSIAHGTSPQDPTKLRAARIGTNDLGGIRLVADVSTTRTAAQEQNDRKGGASWLWCLCVGRQTCDTLQQQRWFTTIKLDEPSVGATRRISRITSLGS